MDELTALLKDEQRLHAESPKVAEYLDTAARLAGTGDEQVDAQFDLRFVHYMTGGLAVSSNPYWDIVEPFVMECNGRRVVNGGSDLGQCAACLCADALAVCLYLCNTRPANHSMDSGFLCWSPDRGAWSRTGLLGGTVDSLGTDC